MAEAGDWHLAEAGTFTLGRRVVHSGMLSCGTLVPSCVWRRVHVVRPSSQLPDVKSMNVEMQTALYAENPESVSE